MLNVNTGLVVIGLLVLLVDITISAMSLRPNRQRAGLLNIVLAIAACAAIAFGMTSLATLTPLSSPSSVLADALTTITATPSSTFVPSSTPTSIPSLTPAPSQTDIVLLTPIRYSGASVATMTSCTLIANTMAYLRGDPSDHQASIGRIFAGSLLQVTAQSTDKLWWQVKYTDNDITIEGWVSIQFVSADPVCEDGSISLIGPTLTPSRTPRVSLTPQSSASTTGNGETASAVTSCIVTTTTAVSLRPDPSLGLSPVTQIPERTAVKAIGRTQVGTALWWHVQYSVNGNSQDGWIGGGSVFTEAACNSLPYS